MVLKQVISGSLNICFIFVMTVNTECSFHNRSVDPPIITSKGCGS